MQVKLYRAQPGPELTTASLSRFIGGQLDIDNRNEDYHYRAEIASAQVRDGDIVCEFSRTVQEIAGEWREVSSPPYAISLGILRLEEDTPVQLVLRTMVETEDLRFVVKGGQGAIDFDQIAK